MSLSKLTFMGTVLILLSCSKDVIEFSDGDHLVFGHYSGECLGEGCIETFKLEKDKLFEDTKDEYFKGDTFYNGDYTQLSDEKFTETKDVIKFFPMDLLDETKEVIGQPDFGDWGGLYIEYHFDGVNKKWSLDLKKSNVPKKYHNFIDKIIEKVKNLK